MNRKEFTNLLLEWRKNFVNERGSNIEFHKDQNQTGHLINPSLSEISGIEFYIRDYIKKNGLVNLNDVANRDYFDNGIVLPKTNEAIKMISDFFLEMSKSQEKSREILATAGNDECVIVHFTEGDFTLDPEGQSKKEKYHWTIHDLEHSLISPVTAADFYFSRSMLDTTSLGKDIKENYNVEKDKGISKNIYEILKLQSFRVSNVELLKRFFEEIDFTPEVGLDDIDASAMSYCYINMEDASDLELINNLSEFNEEEKKQLTDMLKECYEITKSSFTGIKEKLKGCIVIVFTL